MFNYGYPWNSAGTQSYNVSQQAGQSGNINWVQGESGAKSYLVAPGQSVLLMDSESNVFYIKSSDPSGMPMPLRVFDYTERVAKNPQADNANYVTRDELEKRLAEVMNAKQSIQSAEQQQ